MSDSIENGPVVIKAEPEEALLETITPKEYLITNGIPEDDNCEELAFFSEVDIESTRKCLDNMRLIIKDFETQLDWHLQQYMILRKTFNSDSNDSSKDQDLVTISQLSALIGSNPEGNKEFIKRKGSAKKVAGKRRRHTEQIESEEDTEESDEDSDFSETDTGSPKEIIFPEVKEEIIEEESELIEPKFEPGIDEVEAPRTPAKRGRKLKNPVEKTTPKKGVRGRKAKTAPTADLAMKNCTVVLNKFEDGDVGVVKEEVDKDEVVELVKKKAITASENLQVDTNKSTIVINQDNFKYFDYNNCNTSNVFVKFEDVDSLPEFIFDKNITDRILANLIFLVQNQVFLEYKK